MPTRTIASAGRFLALSGGTSWMYKRQGNYWRNSRRNERKIYRQFNFLVETRKFLKSAIFFKVEDWENTSDVSAIEFIKKIYKYCSSLIKYFLVCIYKFYKNSVKLTIVIPGDAFNHATLRCNYDMKSLQATVYNRIGKRITGTRRC